MKKIIFRYWSLNIAVTILLYFAYRITISETDYADADFLDWIFHILDIVVNLLYSLAYLVGMALCSFAIFLNLIDKVRNNFYLSLSSFIGIPLIYVVIITVNILSDDLLQDDYVTIFRNLLIFSIIYLLFTGLQFSFFRKKVNKLDLNP
ncbi:hypothetical protein [Epilithonimonas lactis]|uniref:Uncharacterized protein n=1 Tax=Epilithonimonas lactis TaxID=421072 RepID=A0A085BJN1_9FLAO|nr:hypothetical protein [Epilithonimonas lactis]KFC22676.1 hypothetical protein IO89_06385 [Epilithonimonas lactis]SEQ84086.1 hypothetical protein SAMN04488097_3191 [Epilithonimonas lactis]